MEKHSKRYRSAVQVADLAKDYPLTEAVDILTKFPKAKFDETVELSVRLGVDPTAGDQMIRGTTPAAQRLGQEGPRPRLHRQRARRRSTPGPTMPASRT